MIIIAISATETDLFGGYDVRRTEKSIYPWRLSEVGMSQQE